MTAPRFFLDEPPGAGDAALSERDSHHARDVLRMREGDAVVLVDPEGREYSGRLGRIEGERLAVAVAEQLPERDRGPEMVLFQCLGKGRKMDQVVRQATELGAARIVPVVSERTIVRLGDDKGGAKLERWRRIAREAAKQSRRPDVPRIEDAMDLEAAARELASLVGGVALWEGPDGESVAEAVAALEIGPGDRVGVLVGPEGGLTGEEADILRASGVRLVSLGRRILRTETAGVVGLALVSSELGGLAPDASPTAGSEPADV